MRLSVASLLVVAVASAGRRAGRHPLTPSVPRRLAEHVEHSRSFVHGAASSLAADPRVEEAVASHFGLVGLTLAARAGSRAAPALASLAAKGLVRHGDGKFGRARAHLAHAGLQR